jgi:hypothetical protein
LAYRTRSFQNPLDWAINVEVKKKHLCNGWPFPCFAAHLNERDLF